MSGLAEQLDSRPDGFSSLELLNLLTAYSMELEYVMPYEPCNKQEPYHTQTKEEAIERTERIGIKLELIPNQISRDGYLFIKIQDEERVVVGFDNGT